MDSKKRQCISYIHKCIIFFSVRSNILYNSFSIFFFIAIYVLLVYSIFFSQKHTCFCTCIIILLCAYNFQLSQELSGTASRWILRTQIFLANQFKECAAPSIYTYSPACELFAYTMCIRITKQNDLLHMWNPAGYAHNFSAVQCIFLMYW